MADLSGSHSQFKVALDILKRYPAEAILMLCVFLLYAPAWVLEALFVSELVGILRPFFGILLVFSAVLMVVKLVSKVNVQPLTARISAHRKKKQIKATLDAAPGEELFFLGILLQLEWNSAHRGWRYDEYTINGDLLETLISKGLVVRKKGWPQGNSAYKVTEIAKKVLVENDWKHMPENSLKCIDPKLFKDI